MEQLVYLDVDGHEHARSAWDIHHVFARCKMKGTGEKAWANLEGLTVPIFKVYHNLGKGALHSNVELCPKPTKDMMYAIRRNLHENPSDSPYDKFLGVNELVHHMAETSLDEHTVWLSGRIADNLERQAPFILQGQVIIERVEL